MGFDPSRSGYWCRQCVRVLLGFVIAGSATLHAAELRVLTEEYPPVSFQTAGRASGLGSEVVEEIQHRIGSHVTIQVVPWARGYRMVLDDPDVALFATMRTPERESLFKWVGPLTTVTTSFYAKHGATIRLNSLADAKAAASIVVPREYYSHQVLRNLGFTNLEPVTTPEMTVRMLLAGHGVLIAADNLTLPALLTEAGASRNDVELVYSFMQSQNYIAFSRGTPDELVQSWQSSLDDMKRDGSFARIYEKWLPGESPPGIKPMADTGLPLHQGP